MLSRENCPDKAARSFIVEAKLIASLLILWLAAPRAHAKTKIASSTSFTD